VDATKGDRMPGTDAAPDPEAPGPGPADDRETEVRAALARYLEVRAQAEAGTRPWSALADVFTDDVVYIDPAWGRLEGRVALERFLDESMRGLEDWSFPVEFTAVAGDWVVVRWTQRLPGRRTDGRPYEQSGMSTLHYAGGGRFDYGEDLLNMAHVLEDLAESGWRPGPGFTPPPRHPNRDFRPARGQGR